MEQPGKQQEIKYTITSSDKAALKEFDQKRTLFETITITKSFDKNPKHEALYHALMESILEDEEAMDKGVFNKLKKRNPDNADRDEEASIEIYTTSLTKTKAAKYDLKGIKDMVPTLWSPIKEIEVRRAYQQLYNFMEGDFLRLHLNDIKDMLLLIVQNKLFNLKSDVIVDLAAALRIFTRVRDTFHDMATNLRMGYDKAMPRRIWSNLDKKRSHIMVKDIDRQLREARLMRSLEKNLVEGNTGKTSDCFSGQYDFVIPCSTLSGQIL
ncbi:hypothetical protein Tco_1299026 [Tanacetum coccineum]